MILSDSTGECISPTKFQQENENDGNYDNYESRVKFIILEEADSVGGHERAENQCMAIGVLSNTTITIQFLSGKILTINVKSIQFHSKN